MGRALTYDECETLSAIARAETGSWELVNTSNAESCLQEGWVRRGEDKHYELTEAGRAMLADSQPLREAR
jgi:hypothetical protein